MSEKSFGYQEMAKLRSILDESKCIIFTLLRKVPVRITMVTVIHIQAVAYSLCMRLKTILSTCNPLRRPNTGILQWKIPLVNMHKAKFKLWSQPCWYRYPLTALADIKRIPARWLKKTTKKTMSSCSGSALPSGRDSWFSFCRNKDMNKSVIWPSPCACVHFGTRPDRLWFIRRETRLEHNRLFMKKRGKVVKLEGTCARRPSWNSSLRKHWRRGLFCPCSIFRCSNGIHAK